MLELIPRKFAANVRYRGHFPLGRQLERNFVFQRSRQLLLEASSRTHTSFFCN